MSEIKPALSAEEWAHGHSDDLQHENGELCMPWAHEVVPVRNRHGMAALALCGQPFGFTWEDVDELRAVAEQLPSVGAGPNGEDIPDPELSGLADRIAALLPPTPTRSGQGP